jgi:ferredoxin
MKAEVDGSLCTGCELCVDACPKVFRMEGDVAVGGDVAPEDAAAARTAAEDCPSSAITITE